MNRPSAEAAHGSVAAMDETHAHRSRPRLTVTSPGDLVAAVAVALGFVPTESLVMLVLAPSAGPHARIDLPSPEGGIAALRDVARLLAGAAVTNDVAKVSLVLFTGLERGRKVAPHLVDVMDRIGVDVAAVVAADGERCLDLTADSLVEPASAPYDVLAHRFVARAVADGLPIRRSRTELEAMLRPHPETVAQVAAHDCSRCASTGRPADVARIRAWTRRGARLPHTRDPHLIRGLLDALDDAAGNEDLTVRDAAWSWVTRDEAASHVDLWVAVVRAADVGQAAQAASVLAFHAWLAGQGALAWCALDRVAEIGGTTSLAALVRDLMDRAVPPHAWAPLDPWGRPLTDSVRPGDAATSVVPLRGEATSPPE